MPELAEIEVHQLLGDMSHTILFPHNWPFVIIHGPNGVGKTKILEIVQATASLDIVQLSSLPFGKASLKFHDGQVLAVQRTARDEDADDGASIARTTGGLDVSIRMTHTSPAGEETPWNYDEIIPENIAELASTLRRVRPSLERVGPRKWLDRMTGETLGPRDTMKYVPGGLWHEQFFREVPSFIREEMFAKFNVHLIETQRLLTTANIDAPGRREIHPGRATVSEQSEDLVVRLGAALATNSRTSQDLDRSFPRRLLDTGDLPATISDEEIVERYENQSALRTRLAEVSVLNAQPDLPLPERELHEWERRVLWTYLDDSEQKLATLEPILARIGLLRDIVNQRFLRKALEIDPDRGLLFRSASGEEIAVEQLSSGEQHELVLTYELLFRVPPGSLVLIDEPEISLHIAWQQTFLQDLERIAALSGVRFIIATHSPHIIHTWWDRAVGLYPEPPEFPVSEDA